MRLTYLAIPILLAAAAVPAQDPARVQLGPRSFFPEEYTGELYVNMDALLETDLWEEVERSLVSKPMLAAFRRNFGFRLTDLEEIRIGMVPKKVTYPGGYETYRQLAVTVFLGGRDLALPKPRKREWDHNRRTNNQIGGLNVVQEGMDTEERHWSQPMLWVMPKPGCLVYGDKRLVEPVLKGERRGGVPHPELMAVTVGRRPLAYYAVRLQYDKQFLQNAVPFPFEWYTEDDKPTFLTLRINLGAKSQASTATMRIRFTDGSKGPDLFEKETRASFKKLDTDRFFKRMAFLKKFTKRLTFKKTGADLEISCDLGDAKQAVELSALAQMLPMLMFVADSGPAAPVAVEVGEEEEEVEEEEAKPKAKENVKPKPEEKSAKGKAKK